MDLVAYFAVPLEVRGVRKIFVTAVARKRRMDLVAYFAVPLEDRGVVKNFVTAIAR